MTYDPKTYWQKKLTEKFRLSGVGHAGFSEYYNKWLYKAKIRTLKKTLLSLQIDLHNKSVCDIGVGTGFWIDFYSSQKVKEIVGIDIASVSIENLKQKYPEYKFIEVDISSSSIVSKVNCKFDILNVFDVLYHIVDDKAWEKAIRNICRLTKNNGVIYISGMCESRSIKVVEHVKFRSQKIYEKILAENGFEIITILPLYFFLNRPIFGKFHRLLIKIDNLFAPIHYYLDGFFLSYKRSNLKLIIAKKVKK